MAEDVRTAIIEALYFLNRIEGDGYGGMAEFENVRRGLQLVLYPPSRHDLAVQVKTLGADSLLPDWKPQS